jgi:hypothetical protein
MVGEHLGKAILCLSCGNYVVMPEYYEDDLVKIPISVNHRCKLGLYPKERTEGSTVIDYCEEHKAR